jgi:plastocyanin
VDLMGTTAKRRATWATLSAVAAASLVAVACGGGGASSTATPTATARQTLPSVATVASKTAASSPTEAPAAVATHAPVATPTPVAGPPTSSAPPPTQAPPPPASQTLSIVAKDTKFSATSFTVTAGSVVTIKLDNQDAGVQHNIAVFDPAAVQVAGTELATGPVMQQTSFTPTAPGRYTFKCTVHPQQMFGAITVQ